MVGLSLLLIIFFGCSIIILKFALLEYRKDRIPVLNYHRIIDKQNIPACKQDSYVVSDQKFSEQMKFLKDNNYTAIDLDDYLYLKEHKNELPQKPVIITFDDGYENNFIYAYPILKAFGFKAVIYSVSDPGTEEFTKMDLPEKLLSQQQMYELSQNGISIQGHTATHPHLKLLSNDEIKLELTTCKETLESITRKPVAHMAIPYGSYDKRVFAIARETGYKTIEVPGKGTINLATSPYNIRRFSIHKDTTLKEFNKILSSPVYAIVNRLYALAHLTIRNVCGKKIESTIKKMCARFGLDNPGRLLMFTGGLGILILILCLLFY